MTAWPDSTPTAVPPPPYTPRPTSTAAPDIEALLAHMTLEEKTGQVMVIGFFPVFIEIPKAVKRSRFQEHLQLCSLRFIQIRPANGDGLVRAHSVPFRSGHPGHIAGEFFSREKEAVDQAVVHAAVHPEIGLGFFSCNQAHLSSLSS